MCNVNRLYKEKFTQVIEKLKEVESGVASEYLNPVAQLEDNRRIRVTVAGNVRHIYGYLMHANHWFLHCSCFHELNLASRGRLQWTV